MRPPPVSKPKPGRKSEAQMLGLALTVILTLCATSWTIGAEETIKLTMSTWGSPEFWDLHEEGIAEFEELNPHIDVELLRLPCCDKAYWEAVMVRSAAGQMPDVFRIWSTQQTDIYKSGLALDISPYVAKDGAYFKQFFVPRLGLGDRVYALADVVIVNYLHTNEDMMAKLGLESPSSLYVKGAWDYRALENTARRVARRDEQGNPQEALGMIMIVPDAAFVGAWVQIFGGQWFDHDYKTAQFNQPAAQQALTWLQERFTEGSFVANGRYGTLEQAGEWGLWFNWNLPPAPGGSAGNIVRGYVPFPRGPGADVTTFRVEPWAVATATKHPDEAYRLIKYMAGPGIRFMIAKQGKIPNYRPSMTLLNSHAPRFQYGLTPLQEQLDRLVPQPVPPEQRRIYDILFPALRAIMEGQTSVQAATDDAARQIDAILQSIAN
ncbi:MAG: extracellular solute-binding protein [Firmicutes bacterium]|nr:extracellular solute-binding protein [Bacillota bacterium]